MADGGSVMPPPLLLLTRRLMNEPLAGWTSPTHHSKTQLYPFYRRVVQAITGVRDGLPTCTTTAAAYEGHWDAGSWSPYAACAYPDAHVSSKLIIFAEPGAIRNLFDVSIGSPAGPWTTYPNTVHAPHVYTRAFTIDVTAPMVARMLGLQKWPPTWGYALTTATAEANVMHAATLITEFGTE